MENVNLIAVLAAALASYVIGALWYSVLFGKVWMRERGVGTDTMKGGMSAKLYIIGFVTECVTAFVLLHVVQAFGGSPFEGGFWVWFGFQATLLLNGVMYEENSWKLYGINAGYRLAGLMAMAAIFSLFV